MSDPSKDGPSSIILLETLADGPFKVGATLPHPGQPQAAPCWNCERPVETDWTSCPYCDAALAEGGHAPQTAGVQEG